MAVANAEGFLGIDAGTSVFVVTKDFGRVGIQPLVVFHSAMAIHKQTAEYVAGDAALDMASDPNYVVITAMKAILAHTPGDIDSLQNALCLWPKVRTRSTEGWHGCATVVVPLEGGRSVEITPILYQAAMFRHALQHMTSTSTPHATSTNIPTMFTVPAYFDGSTVAATGVAARMGGFCNASDALREPVAAAIMAAGTVIDKLTEGETKDIVVLDLGGGTFDATLLRCSFPADQVGQHQQRMEVLNTHGLHFCGGELVDKALGDMLLKRLTQDAARLLDVTDAELEPSQPQGAALLQQLCKVAKQAKEDLCSKLRSRSESRQAIQFANGNTLHVTVTQEELREVVKAVIIKPGQRTPVMYQQGLEQGMDDFMELLRSNGHVITEATMVLMPGGSTCLPGVETLFLSKLGAKAEQVIAIGSRSELWVSQGATICAQTRATNTPENPGLDIVESSGFKLMVNLTDVDTNRQYGHVLVKENTPLPTTTSMRVYKLRDEQETVTVRLYEGNNVEYPQNNHLCGIITVAMPPGNKKDSYVDLHISVSNTGRCLYHGDVYVREGNTFKPTEETRQVSCTAGTDSIPPAVQQLYMKVLQDRSLACLVQVTADQCTSAEECLQALTALQPLLMEGNKHPDLPRACAYLRRAKEANGTLEDFLKGKALADEVLTALRTMFSVQSEDVTALKTAIKTTNKKRQDEGEGGSSDDEGEGGSSDGESESEGGSSDGDGEGEGEGEGEGGSSEGDGEGGSSDGEGDGDGDGDGKGEGDGDGDGDGGRNKKARLA